MKGTTDHRLATAEPAAELSPSAAPTSQGTARGWRFALPLLLALYLCFAGIHAAVVPIGQTGYQNAPDEAAHMAYVRSVAAFRLPTHSQQTPYTDQAVGNGYEWHQPPLYYALAAPFLVFGERGVRLFSICCGLVALLLVYRSGRRLFPGDPVAALLAVGLAALLPTHIAITSTVNNDGLLEVGFSATLLLLIGLLQNGFTTRCAVGLGISIGAAILTKVTGLLLLPVFGFAVLLLLRSGVSRKETLRRAGMTLGIVLLLSGWWFARNQALYGQLLPLRLFASDFGQTALAAPRVEALGWIGYFSQAGLWTFFSFWAVYGTARGAELGIPRFLPPQIYLLMGVACLCAAAGLARLHVQRRARFSTPQLQAFHLFFLTIALVGVAYLAFIAKYFQMQGRYLFPAMLPIALVLASGYRGLFSERWKDPASALLLVLLGVVVVAFLRYVLP